MGFQDMLPIVHEAASRKGGRVQTRKGLATLSDERKKEIATLGGKVKYDNSRRTTKSQGEESTSYSPPRVADIPGVLDEQVQE